MPNGERIQFANNVNFIFECHSLEFASPATVSRCGMLFMSDEDMDLDRIVANWMATNNVTPAEGTMGWLHELAYKAFDWALNNPKAVEVRLALTAC